MSKRTYPCQLYTLTSNYNVRKVTFAKPYSESNDSWGAYTPLGKFYRGDAIFDTKAAAVKAGRAQIKRRQKNLERGLEAIQKDTAALDKAEAQK